MSSQQPTSTQPYLIRAMYEWCTDNGFTPHLAVKVDASTQVPMEFVNNGEIVLNVGFDATSGLDMGNDYIRFQARFGGVAREIIVPVDHVVAIYARETGQGMAFPEPVIVPDDAGELPSLVGQREPTPMSAKERQTSAKGLHLVDKDDEPNAIDGDDSPNDDPPPPAKRTDAPGKGGSKPGLRIVK